MCKCAGSQVELYTVEIAFGNRDFVVTNVNDPHHVQIRTAHDLWHKENALNIGFQALPKDWKYAAWIDADVKFARPDWGDDTLHQLQRYDVVQMWTESQDLSDKHEVLSHHKSYVWCALNDAPRRTAPLGYYVTPKLGAPRKFYWHPGYAWAFRRSAFNALGGLIDWTILGGGDKFMADALMGQNPNLPKSLGPTGRRWLQIWRDRADKYIRGNVGYVDGLVLHAWHGAKNRRSYDDRGQILVKADFNPELDLKRDDQGLWQLTDRSRDLRDGIRKYFTARDEDGPTSPDDTAWPMP
jgi:hypothetical protein